MTTPAPCRHMFTMTLRNGDRVCRRCDLVKRGNEPKPEPLEPPC